MTKNIIIAPVGDNMNALYVGLKEFPTERIYLLAPTDYLKAAEKAVKDLERFGIPSKTISLNGNQFGHTGIFLSFAIFFPLLRQSFGICEFSNLKKN